MKVAFISDQYPPYVFTGAGIYAKNIAKELARLGVEVHVVTRRLKGSLGYEVKDSVFIHRLAFINRQLLQTPSFYFNLAREFGKIEQEVGGFDIVHGNGTSDFILGKKSIGQTPRVATFHHSARDAVNTLRPSLFERMRLTAIGGEIGIGPFVEGQYIQKADRIIAVSEYTKATLISIYSVPSHKIEVIYNGWEEKNLAFSQKERYQARDKYNISKDKPSLLFVGRVDDIRKGLDVLLRAFKIVLAERAATLVIAGAGNQRRHRSLLSSLDIASHVIFTGYVDDMTLAKLYSICDVFVCPSLLEGFGLVILDAMAAGKPVVATNAGGIPEIIEPGENGLLVQAGNENELAMAIAQLLNDDAQARVIGENNGRKLRSQYSWRLAAQKTAAVYTSLVNA